VRYWPVVLLCSSTYAAHVDVIEEIVCSSGIADPQKFQGWVKERAGEPYEDFLGSPEPDDGDQLRSGQAGLFDQAAAKRLCGDQARV
jgi:hypothetical protein